MTTDPQFIAAVVKQVMEELRKGDASTLVSVPPVSTLTWGSYLEQYALPYWQQSRRAYKTTYKVVVENFRRSALWKLPCHRLTKKEVWEYQQSRAKVAKPRTVNLEMAIGSGAWSYGVQVGVVSGINPFRLPKLKISREDARTPMTPEQFEALLRSPLCPWFRVFCQLGFLTGLRTREALGLRWKDVDLVHRKIRLTTPKSGEVECVYLSACLVPILEGLYGSHHADFPVFQRMDGRPCTYQMLKRAWKHALQAVPSLAGLTPYSLRHGFGTALARSGVNAHVVSRLMRHRDIKVTDEYYVTLNGNDLAPAVDRLAEGLTMVENPLLHGEKRA